MESTNIASSNITIPIDQNIHYLLLIQIIDPPHIFNNIS